MRLNTSNSPRMRALLAYRRVSRGEVWLQRHGFVIWHPRTQFMVSHGFYEDEFVTKSLLDDARRIYRLLHRQ